MHNKNFILHLTLIENIGPAIIQRILERSDISVSDLYLFSASDWMRTCGFTELTAQKLSDGLQNKKILDYELDLIERHNIQWATVEDDTYPALLREIYLAPAVIYAQGVLSVAHGIASFRAHPEPVEGLSALQDTLQQVQGERTGKNQSNYKEGLSSKLLAIVGARKADNYGQHAVNALVPDLVAAHYTIVSGGARGIDTMAHQATLDHGGKTIAVLGSGLLNVYPVSNKKLFESIVDRGGLVVSAFPLTMEGLPGNFPARNRIITGLSHGCLVVQAAQKSGALISAHYAMEQGREVFAVPGPFDSELSAGCNALIQNGAKLVMNSADILTEFGDRLVLPDRQKIRDKAAQLTLHTFVAAQKTDIKSDDNKYALSAEALAKEEHCSEQQKQIIAACKQPTSFDDIIMRTQLTSELVQNELFNLQLDGVVAQDFTGMWVAQ